MEGILEEIKAFLFRLWKLFPYFLLIGFGVLCWHWFSFASASQQDIYTPIIHGVIGGVVTSFLILVFSMLWKSNITPWIENLLYKDTKIEGVRHGLLVPYIGIDEIDSYRVNVALGILKKRKKKASNEDQKIQSNSDCKAVSATLIEGGEEKELEAELILKKKAKTEGSEETTKVIKVSIESPIFPIEVRVELKRVGHYLSGQVVEIGGISQVHTYRITGSFKNLILTGEYENESGAHIDRGSLSLMLRENGNSLEGFFSSYADHQHKMAPFKCILKRQPINEQKSYNNVN